MPKSKKRLKPAIRRYGKGKGAVSLPTAWDMGTGTAAQRAGLVIEDAAYTDPETGKKVNPNGVKRARRVDLVESLHNRGILSKRQYLAAQALIMASERVEMTGSALKKVQVDTSSKPDAANVVKIDLQRKVSDIERMVPRQQWVVIECVVLHNRTVARVGYKGRAYRRGQEILAEGLDKVADGLRI